MAEQHAPGEPASVGGIYGRLNIFGSPTGVRVKMMLGHPLPTAARGHLWMLSEADSEADSTE
jgi:hypothetical protein